MKIKHTVLMFTVMALASAFALINAQSVDFYSTVDPGTLKPPAKPWIPGTPHYVAPGELWLAKLNEKACANKVFTLEIDMELQMDLIVEEMHGYRTEPGGKVQESPITAVTKNDTTGNIQRISTLIFPSPEWEVMKLAVSQPGGGGGNVEVNQDSHCATEITLVDDPGTAPGSYRLAIDGAWFGVAGGGDGEPWVDKVELYSLYQDKWIKPFYQPEYGPPWQDELIYDGSMVIGIRFTAPKGEYLEPGEKYQMSFTTTPKPAPFFDYYAHDMRSGRDIYFNLHARPLDDPLLGARRAALSASTGGSIDFTLCAGTAHANRSYVLLGSVSGTEPGMPLPGGSASLPLNWDLFTDFVWALKNTPVLSNFMGALDGSSNGKACLNCGPLPPDVVGLKMYYAYTFHNPFSHASNHLETEIGP